jgi:hypothetical protein
LLLKPRIRRSHAEKLREELERAIAEARAAMLDATTATRMEEGFLLQVASDSGFELALESLDRRMDGIALVNVRTETIWDEARTETQRQVAVLFVPWGKLPRLAGLIKKYQEEDTRYHKPKNQKLIESIGEIRRATLEALWTDDKELLPDSEEEAWWEIWLR